MSNIVFRSESTGSNHKKSENMWNNFSDNTGDFTNINYMEKNNIEGSSGKKLVISLTFFSTWMLSESKTG